MRVSQCRLDSDGTWLGAIPPGDATLVLVFADRRVLASSPVHRAVAAAFPHALVAGCSTAGSVVGCQANDNHAVVTAIHFAHVRVRGAFQELGDERLAGIALAKQLAAPDLAHLLVLSEGIGVNGTSLAGGLKEVLGTTSITGGLAGDGEAMQKTAVWLGDRLLSRAVVGIGFYGDQLRVGVGCQGGWRAFGPERRITRSDGNVLHELDGMSALTLYRRYLGEAAEGLPATGLLFPMEVRPPTGGHPTVRTLLGLEDGALRFAGDMPVGHFARLMTATTTNLLDGAASAAEGARAMSAGATLALVISCVGRRMVLGQRVVDELGSIADALAGVTLAGFYSYGELAPANGIGCDLHNQTMTLTTLGEAS